MLYRSSEFFVTFWLDGVVEMIEPLQHEDKEIPHGGYDVRYLGYKNKTVKNMFCMNTYEIIYFFRTFNSFGGNTCCGFRRKLKGSKWGIVLYGSGNVFSLPMHSKDRVLPFAIFLSKIM